MQKKLFYFFLLPLLLSFKADEEPNQPIKNSAFKLGERIEYKMRYSFITAGTGVVEVSRDLYQKNNKDCYKVAIYGTTTDFFDNILRVRDSWISYIDTASLMPQQFFRHVEEGKYRKTELTLFDEKNNKAEVKWRRGDKGPQWKTKSYDIAPRTQDIVGLYTYMRNYDYSQLEVGEKFLVNAFFEDELYELEVYYFGKEIVKTKVGKFNAIKLAPVMPKNSVFEGKDAIVFWATDDKNKMLLQAKVKIKVIPGSNAWLEIKEYQGLRHDLSSKIEGE